MKIAVLLITHENIASNMLTVATSILGDRLQNIDYIEVPMDAPVEQIEFKIDEKLAGLKQENGLLILTDIFGSTPSNIASNFAQNKNARLISGVNLPMLVRMMNYRSDDLDVVVAKAIAGGRDGITLCEQETA